MTSKAVPRRKIPASVSSTNIEIWVGQNRCLVQIDLQWLKFKLTFLRPPKGGRPTFVCQRMKRPRGCGELGNEATVI